jgi:hypothetical protein
MSHASKIFHICKFMTTNGPSISIHPMLWQFILMGRDSKIIVVVLGIESR